LKSSFFKALVIGLLLARWAAAQCDDLECVPAQAGPPSATSGYVLKCFPQSIFQMTCSPALPTCSYWKPRCNTSRHCVGLRSPVEPNVGSASVK